MATIAVPPGKSGTIRFKAATLYLNAWELSLDIDNDSYVHFDMTANADSLFIKGLVTGHATGEAVVRGNFDNTAAAYLPSSKTTYLDQAGACWLGYTALVGWDCTATVISIRTVQAAGQPAGATYEARLKITAVVFDTNGP